FGVPLNKPWKIARALGLTMMLARIAAAQVEGRVAEVHASGLKLDCPLMPIFGPDFGGLLVQALDDLRVLRTDAKTKPEALREICEMLDSKPFNQTLEAVVRLNRHLGIN